MSVLVSGSSLARSVDAAESSSGPRDMLKTSQVMFLLFAFGAAQNVNDVIRMNGLDGTAARIIVGSIFNPSVTLALFLAGVINPLRFTVGGIIAAAIVDGLAPGHLMVSVALGNDVSRTRGLFIGMFATAGLTLSVLMLAAEKHKLTPMAPLRFGIILMVVMLFPIQFIGGAVNTVSAFGPACIQGFTDYYWIYWLVPTLGSLLATGVYRLLKYYKYWEVTPGQDDTADSGSSSAA